MPHLVPTVRRFIDEEERVAGKASTAQRRPASPMAEERDPELAVDQSKLSLVFATASRFFRDPKIILWD